MMAIAEDSRFESRMQEILTEEPVWVDSGPTQLTDYLFLGSAEDARDVGSLRRLGITYVINCAALTVSNKDLYDREGGFKEYIEIPAEDDDDYDILQHLPEFQRVVDRARDEKTRAFIHCGLGVNRSGALCVAYMMLEYKAALLDVFTRLKEQRGVVCVSDGFQRQLIHLARENSLLYHDDTIDRD